MAGNIPVKTLGKSELSHIGLGVEIKKMLNDIIDLAFRDTVSPKMLGQFKRFTIFASETELGSKLGDCWHNKDGSASIRLLGLSRDRYQDSLITAIHEVSHHVDRSLHGGSSHGPEFYRIHKLLLYAAFDMGILKVDDVIHSESHARNRDKLAKMMVDYAPHPTPYKADIVHIFVYHSFDVKDRLKERGYRWNGLDLAWTKEIQKDELKSEEEFLLSIGLSEADIRYVEGGAVVTRLRKSAKLFNVPRQYNATIKKFGYHWHDGGRRKYWRKILDGDNIPDKEREALEKIKGLVIKID